MARNTKKNAVKLQILRDRFANLLEKLHSSNRDNAEAAIMAAYHLWEETRQALGKTQKKVSTELDVKVNEAIEKISRFKTNREKNAFAIKTINNWIAEGYANLHPRMEA